MGFIKRGKGKIKQVFRFIRKADSDDFELKKTYDDEERKGENKSNGKIKKSDG